MGKLKTGIAITAILAAVGGLGVLDWYGIHKNSPARNLPQPKKLEIQVSTRGPGDSYLNKDIVRLSNTTEGFECTLDLSQIKRDGRVGRNDIMGLYYWDTLGSHGEGLSIQDTTRQGREVFDQSVYVDSNGGKHCLDLVSNLEQVTGPLGGYRVPMNLVVRLLQ